MATIKKPGYQDPKILATLQAGLDKQPGAQFIAQKLPQSVLDQIAARRAKAGLPAFKQATPPATQPEVQPTVVTQPQTYKGSEDLTPQPTQTAFRQSLDSSLQQKYDFARDLYSQKFGTSLKPESLDYLAQRVVQQEQQAMQPKDTLSPAEKAQFRAMGVTDYELRKLESGERTIDDIYATAERVQKQKEAEIQKQAEDRISAMRERTMAQYEPQFKEVERQRGISMSNVSRTAAAKGRAVSSVTADEFENVTQSYNQQANALRAERDARIALQEAQIQGASDEVIAGLSSQYDNARAQLMQSQAQNEALQAQALQAAQEFGDTTLMDLLSSIEEESNAQNDLNFDKSLTEAIGDGFAYGANGERLVNASGQELTTNQQSFNSRYKRVGTQADAFTGEIFAIYEDKTTGQAYYEPMTELSRGATQPGYQPATSPGPNGFRTDRHRNPLAITTDVARQGGLQESVDFTQGDPFLGKDGRTYYTANILTSDPMQTMVDVFDKIGFTTQSGGNRFDYLDGRKADAFWATLSNEQKLEEVAKQYMEKEKGSGELLRDAMPSAPQPTMTEAQPTAVRSTPLTSFRDRKMMEAEMEREIEAPAMARQAKLDFDKTDFGTTVQKTAGIFNAINKLANFDLNTINNFDPANQQQKIYNALQTMAQFELKEMQNLGTPQAAELALLKEEMGQYTAVDQFFVGALEGKKTALLSAFNLTDGMARKLRELGTPEERYQLSVLDSELAALSKDSNARANLEATRQYIQDRLAFVDKLEEASLVFLDQYGQLLNNVN